MKYNTQKVNECAAWVREHGLMDYGGATLRDFCGAMGVDDMTYYSWMRKPEFSEAIKEAREAFRSGLQSRVENSLARLALGYDWVQVTKKYIGGKDGRRLERERTERTMHVSPNVGAAIFLLCNLDPVRWKNRQVQDVQHTGMSINIETSPEGKECIERILAGESD